MKKLLPLLFISCLFYQSCEKETNTSNSAKSTLLSRTISAESTFTHPTAPLGSTVHFYLFDGRIIVENTFDFELLLWSLQSEQSPFWEKEIDFKSYASSQKGVPYSTMGILKKALNKDGLIQVNPWIFKLDFKNRKVYVLSQENKQYLTDLISMNGANKHLRTYSFDDDVWSLIEKEQTQNPSKVKRCKEPRAKNKYVSSTAASCVCTPIFWQNTTIAVRYNRFGIWETVKAYYYNNYYDVYGQNNNHFTASNLLSGTILYHFDERCGAIYNGTISLVPGQFSYNSYTLRSNKKPLERNKSIVNMTVNTSYVINPPEPVQTLNTILNSF